MVGTASSSGITRVGSRNSGIFLLFRLGCGILNYREQAQQIELKTGGMTVTPHVLPDDSQLDTYEQVGSPSCPIILQSKATVSSSVMVP